MTYEEINHPDHYGGDTPYEAIKVIEAWEVGTMTPTSGFTIGNAIKYIARLGKKPGSTLLKDLKKIQFYVNREIENEEKREEGVAGEFDDYRNIFNAAIDSSDWVSRPLGVDPVSVPSAYDDPKPNFYDTPSHDPIVRTAYMFDRDAGHNVPAYEHKSGRISLDGDTTV